MLRAVQGMASFDKYVERRQTSCALVHEFDVCWTRVFLITVNAKSLGHELITLSLLSHLSYFMRKTTRRDDTGVIVCILAADSNVK